MMDEFILLTKTLPSFVSNLWWMIVMDDCHGWWKLDEKSLGKWQYLQHYKSIIPPPQKIQGMTNNVGLTFGISDTTPWFSNWYWARRLESVTLNIIFSCSYFIDLRSSEVDRKSPRRHWQRPRVLNPHYMYLRLDY
jgi:hypothetical protein